MQVSVSDMELEIARRLTKEGIGFESQPTFPLQATKPNFYFAKENVAVYLDAAAIHSDSVQQTKREAPRSLWEKRYHGRAVGITYQGKSKEEKDRVWNEVLKAIGRR